MDYPGKVITKTQVTPTQTSASGNWTLDDQAAAIKNNNWPVALVPNPISKSLRFNSADTAYLSRTPASTSNRRTWTWSGWMKRSTDKYSLLFAAGNVTDIWNTGTNCTVIGYWISTNQLTVYNNGTVFRNTAQLFRDPSAWYHIVVAFDTTKATAADRLRVYINGAEVTSWDTNNAPTQNLDMAVNVNQNHFVGGQSTNVANAYFSGYLTEINFVDGQQLTPSDFGLTNPQTGQWIPKKYTGTYGTNGFYLNFKDATSTTTLGYDYSGNANNWTTNNFSVTAGSGNDSLTDVPTPWVAYNTTGDVGGVIRGNYATLNPLIATATLSNGNLDFSQGNTKTAASMGVTSGKWYCEAICNTTANRLFAVGVAKVGDNSAFNLFASGVGYYADDGSKYVDGTNSAYGATYTAGDTIGIALNMDAGTVTFYKNNTSQGSISLPTSSQGYYPLAIQAASGSTSATWSTNFGQRPFAYTPPAGFRSLCTTNLPATTIGFGLTNQANDYFDIQLWAGNSTNEWKSSNVSKFNVDFGWIKNRTAAYDNTLVDIVRGDNNGLVSNSTAAENSAVGVLIGGYGSYTANAGQVYTNGAGYPALNVTGNNYVNWRWRANGTGVTNTAGTITSTVSANTTSGFSIVTYTGTGANATVGHGLGVAPSMVITKGRDLVVGVTNWKVYHASLGNTKNLNLNLTNAETTSSNVWNNTSPTSTVFSIGTTGDLNGSGATYVAYCFAAVAGYSAFGSFGGTGTTDNTFIYTGFRPKFALIKRTDSTSNWFLLDSTRSPYNVANALLRPNLSDAEITATSMDFVSNGIKLRDGGFGSGETYIYIAFAESPFQFSNAR